MNGNGNSTRRRGLLILALAVLAAGTAWGLYWFLHARWYVSTDDAYVGGNIVQVNAEVPGTVRAVHVRETETVARGQPLVDLDPADAQVAMDAAAAELANVVRQVNSLYSQAGRLHAQVAARDAELARARDDLRRRDLVVDSGAVSQEEVSHAREQIRALEAGARAAREELNATLAQIEGTTVEDHPQVQRAAARVREAALALRRAHVVAPVGGLVARKAVQVGQRVAQGAPLLAVVPLNDLWVDANFKEVQLEGVRIGQPVKLRADLYGRSVTYDGRIDGISPGTGSVFALLPAQNASGNWIKIVQRVPVRIALDAEQITAHPLRVGLSMHAEIDLHDRSGPLLAAPRAVAPGSAPAQERDPALEARIAEIISLNSGQARNLAR